MLVDLLAIVQSGGASKGDHVLETNEELSRPSRTVEKILEAHPMNADDFWGGINPDDVSIYTTNSKEMMTGSHITEEHTHKYQVPVTPELSNKAANKPQTYNFLHNY